MFKNLSSVLTFLLVAAVCSPFGIRADQVIDFEQFDVGDGLAEINAYYSSQGIFFVTEDGAGVIQNVGGSKVFAAFTPDAGQLDILINFPKRIDQISADFLDNGGTNGTFSLLEGFEVNKLTSDFDPTGYIFGVGGNASVTLDWTYPGPGPVSPIRALHLSQDLGSNDFVTIDNIRFSQVPEPGTVGLFSVGFVLIGLRRRR